MPRDVAEAVVAEGGLVENASALLYGIGILIAALQLKRHPTWPWLSGLAMLLWMFLRELDYQKAFTYRSVESVPFYTGSTAPGWQKVLALLILAPFAVAGLHLFRLGCRNVRHALAQRNAWPGHFMAIALLGIIAQSSEKLLHRSLIEEVCELGIALLVLVLTLEFKARSPARPPTSDAPAKQGAGR